MDHKMLVVERKGADWWPAWINMNAIARVACISCISTIIQPKQDAEPVLVWPSGLTGFCYYHSSEPSCGRAGCFITMARYALARKRHNGPANKSEPRGGVSCAAFWPC